MMDYRFKNSTLHNSNVKPNNNSMSKKRRVLNINSLNSLIKYSATNDVFLHVCQTDQQL